MGLGSTVSLCSMKGNAALSSRKARGWNNYLSGSRIGKGFHPRVKLVVEPSQPTTQACGAGACPMVLEVDAMAKVGVEKIAKNQVAFQGLH